MAADKKAAAGFKALAEIKPAQGTKPYDDFVTPVKAASGKTRDRGSVSVSKISVVLKVTPVITVIDSADKDLEARALYHRGCDQLDEEYLSKASDLHSATKAKWSAYERAHAEYETAHSRLPAEPVAQTVKFVNQLRTAALGIFSDYRKTFDALDAIGDRYDLKFIKLKEILKGSISS